MSVFELDHALRQHLPQPDPRHERDAALRTHIRGCRCDGCEDARWEVRWVEAQQGLRCTTCLVEHTVGLHLRWCPEGSAA